MVLLVNILVALSLLMGGAPDDVALATDPAPFVASIEDEPSTPAEPIAIVWDNGRPQRALTEEEQARVAAGEEVDIGPVFIQFVDTSGRVWWTDYAGHTFPADDPPAVYPEATE